MPKHIVIWELPSKKKDRLDEAIAYYQKALQLDLNFTNAYINIGNALYEQGKQEESISAFDRAILLASDNIQARLAKCISQIPIIYSDPKSIQICRSRYYDELVELQASISFETLQDINFAAEAVGSRQPFYLAHQGFNDRELQCIYGDIVCNIMSSRYPHFADRPTMSISFARRTIEGWVCFWLFFIFIPIGKFRLKVGLRILINRSSDSMDTIQKKRRIW